MSFTAKLSKVSALLTAACALSIVQSVTAAIGGPEGEGRWSDKIDTPIIAVSAANLATGKVMLWSSSRRTTFPPHQAQTYKAIFDPISLTSEEVLVTKTQHDMFCPGTTSLADGRVMVHGGNGAGTTSIFDPLDGGAGDWQKSTPLKKARGYHSSVMLPSGSVFTIGGSWSGGIGGKYAEVWNEDRGWYPLYDLGPEVLLEGATDPEGELREDNHSWLFAAPGERLFHGGPGSVMHWFDVTGSGSSVVAGTRADDEYSINATVSMYDIGKILKVGGAGSYTRRTPSNARSYIIDVNNDAAVTRRVADASHARTFANSVVLPTGEVMVIGGLPKSQSFSDDDAVMVPEIWSPRTETWRDADSIAVPRNYHSTALLLSDGRVLAAGGGQCGQCSTNHADLQIYSPAYLFDESGTPKTRPQLLDVPTAADYGETLNVSTQGAIDHFVMMRFSTVTHSVNTDQRRVPLQSSARSEGNHSISIPTDRGIAPPGLYMLFAMSPDNVPSVSAVVEVGSVLPNDSYPLPTPEGAITIYRNGQWYIDSSQDYEWSGDQRDGGLDQVGRFGGATDIPVVGIGASRIGVYRPTTNQFFFDTNNNLQFDGCGIDLCTEAFGQARDQPVVLNDRIGVFRPATGQWFIDNNHNQKLDACGVDLCVANFGGVNDVPMVRNGALGVYRTTTREWFFDTNGNRAWDGCATDACVAPFGNVGDRPFVNPHNGIIGVFRPSTHSYLMDINNSLSFEGCEVDWCTGRHGGGNDIPIMLKQSPRQDETSPAESTSPVSSLELPPEVLLNGVRNVVSGLLLDGELADWSGVVPLAQDDNDTRDDSNPLDWQNAYLAHDARRFYFAYRNYGAVEPSWGQSIYIDTDLNQESGYNDGLPIGADVLVQGNYVYVYSGDGSSWSWDFLTTAAGHQTGDTAEYSLTLTMLGSPPAMRLLFIGSNEAYDGGSRVDLYPDGIYDDASERRYFTYLFASEGNTPPTVKDQALLVSDGQNTDFSLNANDIDGDALSYTLVSQPQFGTLEGTPPALTYSPQQNYTGPDRFTFSVTDGESESIIANVNISVTATFLSNRKTAPITLDGNLADWSSYSSFRTDPQDIDSENNPIDFIESAITHDDDDLYVFYRIAGTELSAIGAWGFNLYLDSDSTATTGYRVREQLGADFLAQGDSLYQYSGDGLSWSWNEVGPIDRATGPDVSEIRLSRIAIGNPSSLHLAYVGDNLSLDGSMNDLYPDAGEGTSGSGFFAYSTGALIVDDTLVDLGFALPENVPVNGATTSQLAAFEPTIFHSTLAPTSGGVQTGSGSTSPLILALLAFCLSLMQRLWFWRWHCR